MGCVLHGHRLNSRHSEVRQGSARGAGSMSRCRSRWERRNAGDKTLYIYKILCQGKDPECSSGPCTPGARETNAPGKRASEAAILSRWALLPVMIGPGARRPGRHTVAQVPQLPLPYLPKLSRHSGTGLGAWTKVSTVNCTSLIRSSSFQFSGTAPAHLQSYSSGPAVLRVLPHPGASIPLRS